MFFPQVQVGKTVLNFGLVIIDMQNGFVSRNGSYDKLGMNTRNYRKIVPIIRNLISFCRKEDIPILHRSGTRAKWD